MQTVNNYKNFSKTGYNLFPIKVPYTFFPKRKCNISDSKEGNRVPEFVSRSFMCF